MSPRLGSVVAWLLGGVTLVTMSVAISLTSVSPVEVVPFALVLMAFAGLGAVIVTKSGNAMGWLYCTIALSGAILIACTEYMELAGHPRELRFGVAAALGAQMSFMYFFTAVLVAVPLFYPTGRMLGGRWRLLTWPAMGLLILALLSGTFGAQLDFGDVVIDNPWAISFLFPITRPISEIGFDVMLLAGLLAIASLVVRFVKSRGDERQQIKWLMYAGVIFVLGAIGDEVLLDALEVTGPINVIVEFVALGIGLLGIPVATGLAILRYRLYDIDRLVNKTLVYVVLTAILALAYVGAVGLLQVILPLEGNDLAVAASTLTVAALFAPLRRRIQAFVDHRFYRRRYDAAHTIEEFSARLRDEVDLEELRRDLLGVVGQTIQPQHATLWLRGDAVQS